MMHHRLTPWLISLALLGCGDAVTPTEGPVQPTLAAPALGFSGRTTPAATAIANLSAGIDGRRAQLARQPQQHVVRAALIDALLTRAAFLGTFDDFYEADQLSQAAMTRHGDAARVLRAKVLAAVHQFDAARRLRLAAGEPVHGIDLATGGPLPEIIAARRAATQATPSFATWAALAPALAADGQFQAADDAYLQALALYRDVAPFPVAWVQFQRGVMWSEQADAPHRARPLYEAAVQRLPGLYVRAHVHLAEIYRQLGRLDDAQRTLEAVLHHPDPEPAGLLAALLLTEDPARAAELIAQATARYDALLSRYPEAFADHASEFFAGPGGDPPRALRLAQQNLALRPTDRAYALAISAAVAAEQISLACQLVVEAGDARTNRPLQALRRAVRARHCP
jgi:tetratricopeptide (TPR) repeat protein